MLSTLCWVLFSHLPNLLSAICYLLFWVAVKATQPYWVLVSYFPNPGCSHAKTSPARKSDPVTRIGSGSL